MEDDEFLRELEYTFEMIEKQFPNDPEAAKRMKEMFLDGVKAFAGKQEHSYPSLEEQSVTIDALKMKIITRNEYPSLPRSIANYSTVPYFREFSKLEIERMSYGLDDVSMDEKWIIIMENDQLYFYRSWPPNPCVYKIELDERDGSFSMNEFYVDNDLLNAEWNSKKYAKDFLIYLIERLLLGKMLPFPFPENIKRTMERSMFRHGMVGSSLANGEE